MINIIINDLYIYKEQLVKPLRVENDLSLIGGCTSDSLMWVKSSDLIHVGHKKKDAVIQMAIDNMISSIIECHEFYLQGREDMAAELASREIDRQMREGDAGSSGV